MRTDIHRPSIIIPKDYECIDEFWGGNHEEPGFGDPERQMEKHGHSGAYENPFQCDICGARFNWGAVFQHLPTGQVITTGMQCAARHAMALRTSLNVFKRQVEYRRRLRAKAAKMRIFVRRHPNIVAALRSGNRIVQDIRSGVCQWGAPTYRQAQLVRRLVKQDKARAVKEAADNARLGELICVPEGRVQVTGEVLGTKEVEGYMGGDVTKMLFRVETDEGWFKLWGSLPNVIGDWNDGEYKGQDHKWQIKGQRLTFKATLQPKAGEKGFGFFKNPRSCKWLP